MAGSKQISTLTIDSTGLTQAIDLQDIFEVYVLKPDTDPVILAADVTITFTGTVSDGLVVMFEVLPGFILTGADFVINGVDIQEAQCLQGCVLTFIYTAGAWQPLLNIDFSVPQTVRGENIADNTIAPVKFGNSTRGFMFRAGAAGVYQEFDAKTNGSIVGGNGTDVGSFPFSAASVVSATITAGQWVFSYLAASITNAAISATAAIARTKLASGTASQVLINDGSGVMTSEARLAAVRGGTGQDFTGATGVQKWSAGTASASPLVGNDITGNTIPPSKQTQDARTVTIVVPVSFETDEQCANKVQFGFKGTVTAIYGVVVKALAATDTGTVIPKNAGGATMASGTLTFPLSSALDASQSSVPTTNQTFNAGDVLIFATAKTTAGGKVLLSITVERAD